MPEADWARLSEDEGVRALLLRKHEDRVRSVATRAALRRLLAAHLRQAPHALRFVSNRHGKPRLPDEAGIDFNVSHAGGFALIALSNNGALGVDIECCNPEVDEVRLATPVLSPFERELGADRQPEFFER